MSRNQSKSGPAGATDLRNALRAFQLDMQLEARWIITLTEEGDLKVRCESYREVDGARVGIAVKDVYVPSHQENIAIALLQASYYVFHYSEDLAYGRATTPEGQRITRKK